MERRRYLSLPNYNAMEKHCPSLVEFKQLPVTDQLETLLDHGEVLPFMDPEEVTLYQVADYYVSVTLSLTPWAVKRVEAFAQLPVEFG